MVPGDASERPVDWRLTGIGGVNRKRVERVGDILLTGSWQKIMEWNHLIDCSLLKTSPSIPVCRWLPSTHGDTTAKVPRDSAS